MTKDELIKALLELEAKDREIEGLTSQLHKAETERHVCLCKMGKSLDLHEPWYLNHKIPEIRDVAKERLVELTLQESSS